MNRPSPMRLGLLRLLADGEKAWEDEAGKFPGVYLPGLSDLHLRDYGLTVFDHAVVTFAAKAGLVERDHSESFAKLTDAGRAVLEASK